MIRRPANYPNVYVANDYKYPKMAVITWLRTPSGKLSKHYNITYALRKDTFLNMTIKEIFEYLEGKNKISLKRKAKSLLKKGYTIDKLTYVVHNDWDLRK